MRGGDGQTVEFGVRTGLPWTLNLAPTGIRYGPEGLEGGDPGATGRLTVNGKDWQAGGKVDMQPDDIVQMQTPGAGGFGPPNEDSDAAGAADRDQTQSAERRSCMSAGNEVTVHKWTDLPMTEVLGGMIQRAGFRSDGALLTFNWIDPSMKRWQPHSHPFDQIVLSVSGSMTLEIDDETLHCAPGSITRVPANARHTGWPDSDEPVLNIDVFAPPRPDYLFLVEHQSEFPQPEEGYPVYHQTPKAADPFSGKKMENPEEICFQYADLPKEELCDGMMKRSGFRGDDALITFNTVMPGIERPEPHNHPFDQLVLVLSGEMILEVDGRDYECGPGTITRVPSNAMHTGEVAGNEPVLNMDVFAPVRQDYLHLVNYQKDYA